MGGSFQFGSWSPACTTQRDIKILSQNQNRSEQNRKKKKKTRTEHLRVGIGWARMALEKKGQLVTLRRKAVASWWSGCRKNGAWCGGREAGTQHMPQILHCATRVITTGKWEEVPFWGGFDLSRKLNVRVGNSSKGKLMEMDRKPFISFALVASARS